MGQHTEIQWCHHTFNGVRGCTVFGPGCLHCYAETLSHRNPKVLGVWGPKGSRVVAAESYWKQPIRWDRLAAEAGERCRVFAYSLGDVFEVWRKPLLRTDGRVLLKDPEGFWFAEGQGEGEPVTLDDVRDRLKWLMHMTPSLDWLLLTKRARNMAHYVADHFMPPNFWAGVTVENREHGLPRVDVLRDIPAKVRFLSVEPLLEDLGEIDLTGIDWLVVGGESGPKARPFNLQWARSLRRQCEAAGTKYFFKQAGARPFDDPTGGNRYDDHTVMKLRDSHGGDLDELPEDLRIREVPAFAPAAA